MFSFSLPSLFRFIVFTTFGTAPHLLSLIVRDDIRIIFSSSFLKYVSVLFHKMFKAPPPIIFHDLSGIKTVTLLRENDLLVLMMDDLTFEYDGTQFRSLLFTHAFRARIHIITKVLKVMLHECLFTKVFLSAPCIHSLELLRCREIFVERRNEITPSVHHIESSCGVVLRDSLISLANLLFSGYVKINEENILGILPGSKLVSSQFGETFSLGYIPADFEPEHMLILHRPKHP